MPSLPGNVQEHPPQDSSGDNGARKKPPKSANPHTRRPPAELTSPAFKEQYEPQLVQQRQREQALTARPKSSAKKELATQVGGGRNSQLHNSSKFLQVVAHEEPRGNAPAKEVTSQDAEEAAEQQVDRKGHHGGAAAAKEFYEATRRVATQFSPEIGPASPGEDTILGPNYAIEEWLDDMLQEGYGSSYGSIFRSEGVDDTDQLSRIKPRQVSSILSKVQDKAARRAIRGVIRELLRSGAHEFDYHAAAAASKKHEDDIDLIISAAGAENTDGGVWHMLSRRTLHAPKRAKQQSSGGAETTAQGLAEFVLGLPCPWDGEEQSDRALVAAFIGLGNAFSKDRLHYAVSFREVVTSSLADDSAPRLRARNDNNDGAAAGSSSSSSPACCCPGPEHVAAVIARIDNWVVNALRALFDGDDRFTKPLLALFGNVVWTRQTCVVRAVNQLANSKLGAVASGIEQGVFRTKGLGTSLGAIGAQFFARSSESWPEKEEHMLAEDLFAHMVENAVQAISERKVKFQKKRTTVDGELRKAIMAAILWLLNLAAEPRFRRRVKRAVKRTGGRFKAAPLKDVLETAEEISNELKSRQGSSSAGRAPSNHRAAQRSTSLKTARIDGTRCGVAYADSAALARGYEALTSSFAPLSVRNTFDPSFDAPAKTAGYRFILMTTLHVDPDRLTWGAVLDDAETKREWEAVLDEFCASVKGKKAASAGGVDWEIVLSVVSKSIVSEARLRERTFAFISEIQVLHSDYLKMRQENRLWFKLDRITEAENLWGKISRYCPD